MRRRDFITIIVTDVSLEGREERHETLVKRVVHELRSQQPAVRAGNEPGRGLSAVADVIHPHSGPDGGDTAAPATLLVDRQGVVRWTFRPSRFLSRLSPEELLAAIDQYLPREG